MWYAPGVRSVKNWSSRRKVSVRVSVKPVVTCARRVQKRAAIRVERAGRAVRGVVLNANRDVNAVQKAVHRVGVVDAFVGGAMRTLAHPTKTELCHDALEKLFSNVMNRREPLW